MLSAGLGDRKDPLFRCGPVRHRRGDHKADSGRWTGTLGQWLRISWRELNKCIANSQGRAATVESEIALKLTEDQLCGELVGADLLQQTINADVITQATDSAHANPTAHPVLAASWLCEEQLTSEGPGSSPQRTSAMQGRSEQRRTTAAVAAENTGISSDESDGDMDGVGPTRNVTQCDCWRCQGPGKHLAPNNSRTRHICNNRPGIGRAHHARR